MEKKNTCLHMVLIILKAMATTNKNKDYVVLFLRQEKKSIHIIT